MTTDMSSILSGSTSPDPVPSSDPAPAPDETPQRHDEEIDDGWEDGDSTGDKPQAPEPGPETPPVEEEDDNAKVPVKALKEERRKRQELERRLSELERPRQNPDQLPPDYDPARARLEMSIDYAREKYEDFALAEQVFIEAVQRRPELYREMLTQRKPAEWAYQVGKKLQALREMGDPIAYREKVLAEAEARARPPQSRHPSVPQTLAAARDSGGRFAPRDGAGHTPMSDILSRR